jgi:hypothetical protein
MFDRKLSSFQEDGLLDPLCFTNMCEAVTDFVFPSFVFCFFAGDCPDFAVEWLVFVQHPT